MRRVIWETEISTSKTKSELLFEKSSQLFTSNITVAGMWQGLLQNFRVRQPLSIDKDTWKFTTYRFAVCDYDP